MRALITVSGVQDFNGTADDTVELVTDGVYTRTEDGFEIYYLESELTGLAGTATRVEVRPGSVTVERAGTLNACSLNPGKRAAFSMIPSLARLHSRSKQGR